MYLIVHRNCLLRVQCYYNAVNAVLVHVFPTVAVMRQDPKRVFPLAADWRGGRRFSESCLVLHCLPKAERVTRRDGACI